MATTATEYMLELIEEGGDEFWAEVLSIAGIDWSFPGTEPPQWLKDSAIESLIETFDEDYWQGIVDTTRWDIQQKLMDGIEDGMSIRDVAKNIMEDNEEYSRSRATNVARTEIGEAMNAGHAAAVDQLSEETGIPMGREWVSVFGPTSRDNHMAMEASVTDADGNFTFITHDGNTLLVPWPAHRTMDPADRCNCFPSGVLVEGQIRGAMRCWYEGRFTEIVTRTGRRLTLTPNHPVVTASGLIGAGMIRPGDQVLSYDGQFDLSTSVAHAASSDDVQYEPVTIEQVFESFASWVGVDLSMLQFDASPGVEVRGAEMNDFYGDGRFVDGDIKIVRPDWELLLDTESTNIEKRGDAIFTFESAELPFEPCSRPSSFDVVGVSCAATCIPGRRQELPNSRRFIGRVSPSGFLSIGVGSYFDVVLGEASRNGASGIAVFLREALKRHAGAVFFDDVVEVRNYESSGHVFDLESEVGVIIAQDDSSIQQNGGIVTSNCQCHTLSTFVMEMVDGGSHKSLGGEKHLPGQHDQSTHGHRLGMSEYDGGMSVGNGVDALSEDKFKAFGGKVNLRKTTSMRIEYTSGKAFVGKPQSRTMDGSSIFVSGKVEGAKGKRTLIVVKPGADDSGDSVAGMSLSTTKAKPKRLAKISPPKDVTEEIPKVSKPKAKPKAKTTTPSMPKKNAEEMAAQQDKTIELIAKKNGVTKEELTAKWQANLETAMTGAKSYIHLPPSMLEDVLIDGRYKSQFETNKSYGGDVQQDARKHFEAEFLGVSRSTKDSDRPVYGYLSSKEPSSGTRESRGDKFSNHDSAAIYGEATIELKPSTRSRSTMVLGDSMNQSGGAIPSPVEKPSFRSASLEWWAKHDGKEPPVLKTGDIDAQSKLGSAFGAENYDMRFGEYAEIQVHGGVPMSDVAKVWLPAQPSSKMKSLLEQRGLPWQVMEK